MMLLLPMVSMLIIYIDIQLCLKRRENGQYKMLSLLYGICIATLIIWGSNEILSIFHLINYVTVSIVWGIAALVSIFVLTVNIKKQKYSLSELKSILAISKGCFDPVIVLVMIVCCSAVYMAVRTVPYNWDSMTYHLTRVVHWAQNGSVAHYSCHDISQISCPPLAEFIVLQVYILSGNSDIFVNLVQALSYVISVFLVYEISKRIGCRRLSCGLAALVFSTTPIVFGEALSTQVDVLAGLWFLIYVYCILEFIDADKKLCWSPDMLFKLILLGLSAGFAYLAKPTVCIGAVIFAVWLLAMCIYRRDNFVTVIRSIVVVVAAALVVALPEIVRNFITFGSIADASTGSGFLIPSWDIRYIVINTVQNISFNLPNKYVDIIELIDKIAFKSAYVIYTGDTIPDSLMAFELLGTSMNHDIAINPIITWLMIIFVPGAIIAAVVRKIKAKTNGKGKSAVYGYIISAVLAMLAFCAIVKWYKFITRYEIGYFAVLAPAIMLAFQYVLDRRRDLKFFCIGIIVFVSVTTFVDAVNYHKNFFASDDTERTSQYFAVRGIYDPYAALADYIMKNGYQNIGFIGGIDSYEYPLWKMTEGFINRFEHVCVTNETNRYDDIHFEPECIIVVDVESEHQIEYHDNQYESVMELSEEAKLYQKISGQ